MSRDSKIQITVAFISLLGVVLAAVIPSAMPTILERFGPTPTASPTPPPSASLSILSFYDQFYSSPDQYPGSSIDTPHHFRTSGETDYVIDFNKYVWMAICPQTTKRCTLRQLILNALGEWNTFIDIGSTGADCAIFDVLFVIVDAQTHNNLKDIDESSGVTQTKFEEKKFEAYIPFAVRPVLDESNQLTAICQTASR
jgi:hypothetical protein